ncbi:PAS domain-containing sensor histidine kinase [Natronorubrum halophilum]|uniref:PAS domain-containing sensor histidine kinase n=1 Tax=Natronorubrum halophilum TaxID=1702106 RepID=UPI0010C238E9|nr:PAS domain-containing sensor histidine kinase [Natronorubrum halophilum]
MGDMTRAFEQQLTERADFHEFIDQFDSVAVWSGDASGFDSMSTAFEDIYGRPVEDVLEDMFVVIEATHPDDRAPVMDMMADRDGRIETGDAKQMEHRVIKPDGDVRWVETRVFPLPSAPGDTPQVVGVTIDITERKRTELELERQNERLERFANILSHDLRNPLTTAKGYLDLATDKYSHKYLDAVDQALTRIEEIITDVLTLSRIGKAAETTETVDLEAAAKEAWLIVDEQRGHLETVNDLGAIEADRSLVGQLFENAFRNAIEHGSTGSRPVTDDSVEHGSQDVTVRVGPLEEANGFYVADDGVGIPESEHEQVFEAGYSTSEKGTGYGLLIIREIVDAHGWDVRITDSETDGVRLEVTDVTTNA